ncbi:MAG: hypothetical protein V1662_00145 [Candidatus Omnitrophota bacterium]
MKEKYIFYTLLFFTLAFFAANAAGRKNKDRVAWEESAVERKLKQAAPQVFSLAKKVNIDQVQDVTSFASYETMLARSPFFKFQLKVSPSYPQEGKKETLPVPLLEDKTPQFIYKGRIAAAGRLAVLIEQARDGEVFMAAQGEEIEGYKILDITDSEVILSNQKGEKLVLPTVESIP